MFYPMSLLLYCLSGPPPPLPSRTPFTRFPKKRMKKVMLISIVALAVIAADAAVILIGVFYGQQEKNRQSEGAPDVKFITFEAEKKEIAVGESTTVLINVRGSEDKVINDTRIVMTIERSGYEPFLLLSNTTIQLPTFLGKDAGNRASPRLSNCHGFSCKRSSVSGEGHGFSGPEPIRSKRISSHYSPVSAKKSFDSVTDGMISRIMPRQETSRRL
jgi:hypothetical protein